MANQSDPRSVAAALLGRIGGSSTSEAKRKSSAANGSNTPRLFPRCPNCEMRRRTCHHLVADPLDAAWEPQFAALQAFHAREGHGNVPARYPENSSLGTWLSQQRVFKKTGTLSPERIVWLEGLGVVWDPLDAAWEAQFAALQAFHSREGHANVPQDYPENPSLGRWLTKQRTSKRTGTLSAERIARLEALGVVWEVQDTVWEAQFAALQAFHAREGHCNVPARYPENPSLGQWLGNQRRSKKTGTLSPERSARLEALGVVWDISDAVWETQFAALQAFKTREGHCNVSRGYPENPSLGLWLITQRMDKKKNKLSPERIARLEALGVVWDPLDAAWETQFEALEAFKTREGHCRVPEGYPENPSLGDWLTTQRQSKRTGTLSAERSARLEALGVVWDPLNAAWEAHFAALIAFKASKGHCNVPAVYPENSSLGNWLNNQRTSKKAGRLSPERIARLEALGVAWDPQDAKWEAQFEALIAFKASKGHCNVPYGYPENYALALWLYNQRTYKKAGKLSPERIARLEALRIVWNPLDAAWEAQFAALKAFKVSKGHGNVPSAYPENSSLGSWLKHQRTYKKMGTLSAERIARLEALGVVWEVQDTVWDEQFAALQAFHAREGHGNVPARYPENPSLGNWLTTQRQSKRTGTLSAERITRLEALRIVWNPLDAAWEAQFAALKAFKVSKGHGNVPAVYPENPSLGMWLMVQRRSKRSGTLSPERIVWLEGLGVVWELRTQTRF